MTEAKTLRELAEILSCEMRGDPQKEVQGVATLEEATSHDASFFAEDKYKRAYQNSHAGLFCVHKNHNVQKERNYLLSDDPARTFYQIIELLCHDASPTGFKGMHPTAVIHHTAKIGKGVSIGPHVVIDRDVTIGEGCVIAPHVSIGPEVHIGNHCHLHPHVVIREGCILHNRVILQPGAIIGACGFGYTQNAYNESIKIRHLGNVILEDDVEVGANATIDRGQFKSTLIRRGAKIDNLVMLAHNTEVGEHTIVIAQAGIAGSTKIGSHCIIAAQAGVVGHLTIEDQVIVAAQSGVGKSLKKGIYGSGLNVLPIEQYRKRTAHINRIDHYVQQLKELKKKVDQLEQLLSQENACQVADS